MPNKYYTYYSNGKLLLTGEYFVLEGAQALALPTSRGQGLYVHPSSDKGNVLSWNSYNSSDQCWLNAKFDLKDFESLSRFNTLTERLQKIFRYCRTLNPNFLVGKQSYEANSHLEFPRDWGLGSSSTLINNIAQWAKVDPFALQFEIFGGSGYDIACAANDRPILYRKIDGKAIVEPIIFDPSFKDRLYFVHLGKKQNSRKAIDYFRTQISDYTQYNTAIDQITQQILSCQSLKEFENLLQEHEQLISQALNLSTAQVLYFKDYWGVVKSLGAWGGDFVLVSSDRTFEETKSYFKSRGFHTFIPYRKMIKQQNVR